MFNLSGSEIIVILLLALVVLGPDKLPDALRRAGRTYAELRKMGTSFQSEMRSALDEPMKEMRETADLLRKSATFDENAVEAVAAADPVGATLGTTGVRDQPDVAPEPADDDSTAASVVANGSSPTSPAAPPAGGSEPDAGFDDEDDQSAGELVNGERDALAADPERHDA